MSNQKSFELTLILPMYNPSSDWAKHVINSFSSLKTLLPDLSIELSLVNDGSETKNIDGNLEILKNNIRDLNYIYYPENKGKGFAVRTGVNVSKGKYVIYTDVDFPYQMENIVSIYHKLMDGADVVYGIRNKAYYENLSPLRRLSSKASLTLNKLFLNIPSSDTQSGIKGFNEVGKKQLLRTKINRYLFDTEFLNYAQNSGCKMKSVEIQLRSGVLFTKMGIKTMFVELFNFATICFNSIGQQRKQNECSGKIFLTFDLEEFDMPLEYGQAISEKEQMEVTTQGLLPLLKLLEKHNIISTFFVTANYAQHNVELVKKISTTHEIASHGYYHSQFDITDLKRSKETLEQMINKPVLGFRMARLSAISNDRVKEAGYIYNSSVNPTWIPGRYNQIKHPRTLFKQNDLVILPVSVSPHLRIPLFWLSFKNFSPTYYKYLSRKTLKYDGYLSLYFHPHEFTDLSNYKIPYYAKKISGEVLLNRLENYIIYMKKIGEFMSIKSFIEWKENMENSQ